MALRESLRTLKDYRVLESQGTTLKIKYPVIFKCYCANPMKFVCFALYYHEFQRTLVVTIDYQYGTLSTDLRIQNIL